MFLFHHQATDLLMHVRFSCSCSISLPTPLLFLSVYLTPSSSWFIKKINWFLFPSFYRSLIKFGGFDTHNVLTDIKDLSWTCTLELILLLPTLHLFCFYNVVLKGNSQKKFWILEIREMLSQLYNLLDFFPLTILHPISHAPVEK